MPIVQTVLLILLAALIVFVIVGTIYGAMKGDVFLAIWWYTGGAEFLFTALFAVLKLIVELIGEILNGIDKALSGE